MDWMRGVLLLLPLLLAVVGVDALFPAVLLLLLLLVVVVIVTRVVVRDPHHGLLRCTTTTNNNNTAIIETTTMTIVVVAVVTVAARVLLAPSIAAPGTMMIVVEMTMRRRKGRVTILWTMGVMRLILALKATPSMRIGWDAMRMCLWRGEIMKEVGLPKSPMRMMTMPTMYPLMIQQWKQPIPMSLLLLLLPNHHHVLDVLRQVDLRGVLPRLVPRNRKRQRRRRN